uniref:Uncharacterized protein n=1 Tax=Vespula pensylvanica TaxID=30213 RepID=A0A834PGB1_VESPE|nr:hypothetical protein H0235_001742 [Vespula pensylvanica]
MTRVIPHNDSAWRIVPGITRSRQDKVKRKWSPLFLGLGLSDRWFQHSQGDRESEREIDREEERGDDDDNNNDNDDDDNDNDNDNDDDDDEDDDDDDDNENDEEKGIHELAYRR